LEEVATFSFLNFEFRFLILDTGQEKAFIREFRELQKNGGKKMKTTDEH